MGMITYNLAESEKKALESNLCFVVKDVALDVAKKFKTNVYMVEKNFAATSNDQGSQIKVLELCYDADEMPVDTDDEPITLDRVQTAVDNLNSALCWLDDEQLSDNDFEYSTNALAYSLSYIDDIIAVSFLGVQIWDSENDERTIVHTEESTGTSVYAPLEMHFLYESEPLIAHIKAFIRSYNRNAKPYLDSMYKTLHSRYGENLL